METAQSNLDTYYSRGLHLLTESLRRLQGEDIVKTTVKEVHDKLAKVLARGVDQECYILVAGTRYPVHVVRALNEVYLIPVRNTPVSFNPMKVVSNSDRPNEVA